jgi:small-conductance mechanosensitive channel
VNLPPSPVLILRTAARLIIGIIAAVAIVEMFDISWGAIWGTVAAIIGTIIFLAFAGWSILGNIAAGIVLMIWRPFEIGHNIEIIPEGFSGEVIDINMMFTKLRTENEEVLSIPNTLVLQKFIKNSDALGRRALRIRYIDSSKTDPKLIEEMLIDSALKTVGVLPDPKPSVLIKGFQGSEVIYELNAYTKDLLLPQIESNIRRKLLSH